MHLSNEKLILSLKSPVGVGLVNIEWQTQDGTLWAVVGKDQNVLIFDHSGSQVASIPLPGICCGFGWDFEGTNLAAIANVTSTLFIWNSNTNKVERIDTGIRDSMTFLAWAKNGELLCIGTNKGNVLIYNHRAGRKIPILGKHSKRITCGSWNTDNMLALGSEDRSLSISTIEGDTVHATVLRAEPSQIQFAEMKLDSHVAGETTVSAIVGRRTLILLNLNDTDNPIELAFQQKYGHVTAYNWFGDGYILVGFTAGYFIAISTLMKEIGQELFQVRNYRDKVSSITVCPALQKVACCGENQVKIHDLNDLKETTSTVTIEDENRIENCSWSKDGRLLAVTGTSGSIYLYLTRLSMLASVSQLTGTIAVLTSLKEVALYDTNSLDQKTCCIQTDVEPNFLACGPKAVALGLNNHSWFFSSSDGKLIRTASYVGSVASMHVNERYTAALVDGKVYLNVLDPNADADSFQNGYGFDNAVFPIRESSSAKITSHALTTDNLVFVTDVGDIIFYSLSDKKPVSEYRHAVGWHAIYPDVAGTVLAAIDVKNYGYIYSPVKETLLRIPKFSVHHRGVLWQSTADMKNVFACWNNDALDVYVYHGERLTGSDVIALCSVPIAAGQIPLMLQGSELILQTVSSKLVSITVNELGAYSSANLSSMTHDDQIIAMQLALALGKYQEVWAIGCRLNDRTQWITAVHKALDDFNIEFAIRVYRHLGDVAMVWSLEEIRHVEDLHLLSGHIFVLLGNLMKAKDSYLKSSQPEMAIEMLIDVMQWDQALSLSEKLAPYKIGLIAREYAQQLEQGGDYVNALLNYELALRHDWDDRDKHQRLCQSGIARCAIGSGDTRKGIQLTRTLRDPLLMKQCAALLEDNKYFLEAAELYEAAGNKDQAAVLYSRLKNWTKVGQLIDEVTQPKVHILYAKAKESQGQYKEALASYEVAGDFESAILLCLNQLHSPEDAIRIARRSRSTEGAKIIGKYFMDLGDYTTALEYLVLSKNLEAAFEVASQHGQMELYAEILGDQAQMTDYNKIATYYEKERNFLLAGKFCALSGQSSQAFKHFIKAAQNGVDEERAINAAIQTVASSSDDQLAAQLISFLEGTHDNIPKDGKYLFRFYLARRQYKEAAKTAVIIATEEQNSGNYRDAHSLLQRMYQELIGHGISIPLEMERSLQLLHSYVIVRAQIRRGHHLIAARLLIRVAESISKFPAHAVPILTSTVIECDRAGLKNAAYQYATILMRSEYRDLIDAKYRKKIESTVRRPPKGLGPDPEEDLTPCPHCGTAILQTQLTCYQCKQPIPICIVTGFHIVKNDLTQCPHCRFFAIRTEFIKIVDSGEPCPMCNHQITSSASLIPHQLPTLPHTT